MKKMKMKKADLIRVARLEHGLNVSDEMTKEQIAKAILDHEAEQERTKSEILQKAQERNNEQEQKQAQTAEHISEDSVIEVKSDKAPTEPTKDEPEQEVTDLLTEQEVTDLLVANIVAQAQEQEVTIDTEKRKASFPYSILKDGEIKQANQGVTIPKNVKNDYFEEYVNAVIYNFIGAKISNTDVRRIALSQWIEEQEQADEYDVEEMDKAKAERDKLSELITALDKERENFLYLEDCKQAEGHALVLAHGEVPIKDANHLLAIYIDTCKALNRFTKDGIKTGSATFTNDEVEAINRFRSVFKTAFNPYTKGDKYTHRLKYGLNESDLVEVLLPQYLTYNMNTGKTKVRFTKKRIAGFTALGMKLILGKANAIEK